MYRIRNRLKKIFEVPENEGQSKVKPLNEAIRDNVKPDAKLFISSEAGAAICEIIRQYHNRKPGFTLITTIVTDHMLNLIYCDLVKKLIFSNCATLYPSARPSKILQRALRNRTIEIENWSLYSLQQRLMAGALGIGFIPTKSIIGSSLAEENRNYFKVINDPFESGEKIGVVKKLNPDIGIIHAWAADPFGNVIPTLHSQDTLWGAKASKNGLVVTVEKIVSTAFIREHSALVKIPGYLVNSVSLAPLGAHPQNQIAIGLPEFESYAEDFDFMADYIKATQNENALDLWTKEWILGCENHQDYLEKLGSKRIDILKRKATTAPTDELKHTIKNICMPPINSAYSETEMMLVVATRIIIERIIKHHYRVLLVGAGIPPLVGWPAYCQLKEKGYHIELLVGSGLYGYTPQPGNSFFQNSSVVKTCKMLTDVMESYGVIVGGEHGRCLSILGAGQIDKHGNINSSKVSDEVYLTGAGGANDNANLSQEVIVVVRQSRNRFLEKVTYITSCGDRVREVVSTLGVLEKSENDELILTKYFPRVGMTKDDIIKIIQDNCSWKLKLADNLEEVPSPNQFELALLRVFDPNSECTKD